MTYTQFSKFIQPSTCSGNTYAYRLLATATPTMAPTTATPTATSNSHVIYFTLNSASIEAYT